MYSEDRNLSIFILTLLSVIVIFGYFYFSDSTVQEQQEESISGLDTAIQNAKDFDIFIIDKIRNAETCDKMKLYLLQYEEKFWNYDYRTMMFEEYDLRCLSEVEN